MQKTFLEFFAGIGLFRLGLELEGWTCLWANDITQDKFDTYAANFGGEDFFVGDVWKVNAGDLPAPAALATASFPCTDLSVAGEREGLKGSESGTVGAFLNILHALRRKKRAPPLVVLENVVGLLTSHEGADVRGLVWELNRAGYTVDLVLIDAVHFVPQSRPRVFLIGVDDKLAPRFFTATSSTCDELEFRAILNESHDLRPRVVRDTVMSSVDLRWGIRRLPKLPTHKHRLADLVEDMPDESPHWWAADQVSRLLSQMSEKHISTVNIWKQADSYRYGTVYRRVRKTGSMAELRSDGIAGCLRTPRGGSSKQIVVRAGRGRVDARWMTPREYGRLQGVPDSFVHSDNPTKAYFGYGDAVCVPVIRWLASKYAVPALELVSSPRRVGGVWGSAGARRVSYRSRKVRKLSD